MSHTSFIRSANKEDCDATLPLLFDAGKQLLTEVFGLGDVNVALDYLSYAWKKGKGRFGCDNHWVAERDNNVIGVISCWHSQLPGDFDRDTLQSIVDFYGIDTALDVVLKSQTFMALMHPPMYTEVSVGHNAVLETERRQGVATALLKFIEDKAQELKKNAVVLNCELDNRSAILFYKKVGYAEHRKNERYIQMIKSIPFK